MDADGRLRRGGVREDEQGMSGRERSLNSVRFYKNSGRQMSGNLHGSRDLAFMAVFHIVWHEGAVKEVIFSLMAPPMLVDHIWDHSGVSGKTPWMQGAAFICCQGPINRLQSEDSSGVAHKS